MALEAGSLFIELSIGNQKEDAERMSIQVDNAKPRDIDEDAPILEVNPLDIIGVFEWCVERLPEDTLGEDRPDLRALISIASKLGKLAEVELFIKLMKQPNSVEDPMLAAICQAICEDETDKDKWITRLTELTMLTE
jgi:hypothetical protein